MSARATRTAEPRLRPARVELKAVERLAIKRLASDSRLVLPGDTFVAYPGESQDGRRYIAPALAAGAGSVLWERREFSWKTSWRVPNAAVTNLRARAGLIASHVCGYPSSRLWMVGVTGTNGKTTCSRWIARALTDNRKRAAVIGTLGYGLGETLQPLANTTPDAVWLHTRLADFERRGAHAVSMEVSSIGIDQHRVAGVEFDVAVLTNLTRDHLDYHGTMRRYAAAKARLFACETLTHAVVNEDDAFGAALLSRIRRRGLSVLGYGFGSRAGRASRITGCNLVADADGLRFDASTPWGSARIRSRVLGAFNASNLLATLAVLLVSGLTIRQAVASLETLSAAPGRMQKLGGGRLPTVVVDYAHTPDALHQVLTTLRALTAGNSSRLLCVFGCGGNRDRGKRPLMGRVASTLADRIWITNDNPRHESPLAIVDDIVAGMERGGDIELNRRRAIHRAIAQAQRGDIVVIAGKGHETYQETGGVRRPFSDVAVARSALTQKTRSSKALKSKAAA